MRLIFCKPLNFMLRSLLTNDGNRGSHDGTVKRSAHSKFCLFSVVPLVYWSEVADNSGVNLTIRAADRAFLVFAARVPVRGTHAECRCQREVWQPRVLSDLLYQLSGG